MGIGGVFVMTEIIFGMINFVVLLVAVSLLLIYLKRKFFKSKKKKKKQISFKDKFFTVSIILNIFLFGVMLNSLAVFENDNKMPVYKLGYDTNTHSTFSDPSEVNLYILTDIFKISDGFLWMQDNLYFSIGDVLLATGVIMITGYGSYCLTLIMIRYLPMGFLKYT